MGLMGLSVGLCSLWRLQGRIHSLPFPAPGGWPHSLAPGPASASSVMSPFLSPHLLLSLLKTFVICSGPTWRIQDNLPVSRSLGQRCLQSLFGHIRYCIRRLWGLGQGHFWPIIGLPAIPGRCSKLILSVRILWLCGRLNVFPMCVTHQHTSATAM